MLKAGFARLDITPCMGTPMAGYFHDRRADGILDPLEANAVAVSDGENTVVIITADLIGCSIDKCNRVRKRIHDCIGIPEECVFFSCLHQHTATRIGRDGQVGNDFVDDEASLETLLRKFVDAAKLAFDDMKEAKVSYGIKPTAERISFTRRWVVDDGRIITFPPVDLQPRLVGMANEPDDNVRVIKFEREGAKDIALVNFSTHPDVIGGTKFSADWPGFTRRFVEADNSDVSCIYVNGAEGDQNHLNCMKGRVYGYEHSRHMGRVIADAVKEIWNDTTPVEGDRVFGGMEIVYNMVNTRDADKYDESKQFIDDYNAGKLGKKIHITELADVYRIVELRDSKLFRPLPVTVIGFGNIALVGFGGEPFVEYGEGARGCAPDRFVITACLTNGSEGYLPTKKAFEQGGYEANASHFRDNLEETCMAAVKKLFERVK